MRLMNSYLAQLVKLNSWTEPPEQRGSLRISQLVHTTQYFQKNACVAFLQGLLLACLFALAWHLRLLRLWRLVESRLFQPLF